jgi:hypothetical protein
MGRIWRKLFCLLAHHSDDTLLHMLLLIGIVWLTLALLFVFALCGATMRKNKNRELENTHAELSRITLEVPEEGMLPHR